ncbi:MAG: hypothetical protein ACYC5N_01940 [Endomicrobiales bacterium]
MNRYSVFLGVVALFFVCFSAEGKGKVERNDNNGPGMDAEEMFVHPFLAHMGMPDTPNEGSLRLTGFQTRFNGMTNSDLALHVEAGLVPRLGLHIRSDGIQKEEFSEVMLQYAVMADKNVSQGISVFGQLNIPTGSIENNDYRGLFGISGRFIFPAFMICDANIHYDPGEKMAEYEAAFVFRASSKYFPILEARGHFNEENELYMLPAIKFKLAEHSVFGVGLQVPISVQKAYDSQALLSFDMGF